MTKVAIIYGWSEGPWHGKKLRQEISNAGFEIIKQPEKADIIIAHSGGCFMLPQQSRAHLVLLVGLPYWPGKHPVRSLRQKIKDETKNGWWLKKTYFNAYYFLTRPRRWFMMWRAWRALALPDNIQAST